MTSTDVRDFLQHWATLGPYHAEGDEGGFVIHQDTPSQSPMLAFGDLMAGVLNWQEAEYVQARKPIRLGTKGAGDRSS